MKKLELTGKEFSTAHEFYYGLFPRPVFTNDEQRFHVFADPGVTDPDCYVIDLGDDDPVEVNRLPGEPADVLFARVVSHLSELRKKKCSRNLGIRADLISYRRHFNLAEIYAGNSSDFEIEIFWKSAIRELLYIANFGNAEDRFIAGLLAIFCPHGIR